MSMVHFSNYFISSLSIIILAKAAVSREDSSSPASSWSVILWYAQLGRSKKFVICGLFKVICEAFEQVGEAFEGICEAFEQVWETFERICEAFEKVWMAARVGKIPSIFENPVPIPSRPVPRDKRDGTGHYFTTTRKHGIDNNISKMLIVIQ